MKFSTGAVYIAVILNSVMALGFDDPENITTEQAAPAIQSTFTVTSVSKANIYCTTDEKGNSITGSIKGEGCAVILKDNSTQKVHKVYAGTKGCSYKVGEIKDLEIRHLFCHPPQVKCSADRKKLFYTEKLKPDHEHWVCSSDHKAYIKGTVK